MMAIPASSAKVVQGVREFLYWRMGFSPTYERERKASLSRRLARVSLAISLVITL
jgi:hypothetical protein